MSDDTTPQPLWYREPRRDAGARIWELWRPEGQKKITLIIASHDVIGTMIHYANGRTRQCEGPNCFACKTGNKPREKGYIGAHRTDTNQKLVVECVPAIFERLRDAFTEHRTLRGMQMQLWRTGKALNAPVAMSLAPANEFTKKIPLAPDVIPICLTIWGHTSRTEDEQRLINERQIAALNQEQANNDDRATGTHD